MGRIDRASVLAGLLCGLLAANLMGFVRGTPAAAQDGQTQRKEETKQYEVAPTNLGLDLKERINAMAAKGWQLKQVIYTNGTTTNWVIYEK
jgi:hypothetical protein